MSADRLWCLDGHGRPPHHTSFIPSVECHQLSTAPPPDPRPRLTDRLSVCLCAGRVCVGPAAAPLGQLSAAAGAAGQSARDDAQQPAARRGPHRYADPGKWPSAPIGMTLRLFTYYLLSSSTDDRNPIIWAYHHFVFHSCNVFLF